MQWLRARLTEMRAWEFIPGALGMAGATWSNVSVLVRDPDDLPMRVIAVVLAVCWIALAVMFVVSRVLRRNIEHYS